ncbi:MAG: hypothetical protein R3C14_15525 [Caldilineaceae bacterium]
MLRKTNIYLFTVAALALVILAGCTMNGGGVVSFQAVETGLGAGTPTDASIAISLNCNDNKNAWRSNINVVDNTNNAHINAHVKQWMPVSEFGAATTCAEAAAVAEAEGFSIAFGIMTSQGQENGQAVVAVSKPGVVPECGGLQYIQVQAIENTPDSLPGGLYFAAGCLDRGKINFN